MQQIDFSLLKEYDSLSKREQQLLREIDQENARTNKINSLIQSHLSRREEIKSSIAEKNALILDKESQLKTLNEQISRLINQGVSEEKIQDYQSKIKELEEQSFALLEDIDDLENQMAETAEFEKGARATLQDIQKEVDEAVTIRKRELESMKDHQQDILSNLPEDVKTLLLKLIKKNLVHGPFTKIEAGCCMMCRFKLSKIEENEIDVHKNVKQCSQCSRIFLPYGV